MVLAKKAFLCLLLCGPLIALAESPAPENFDIQSPAEIARAHAAVARDFAHARQPMVLSARDKAKILAAYDYLDPKDEVPSDLLSTAVLYYDLNKASFPNQNYMTVVDFKPRSDNYRFFLINIIDGSVEKFHTTHGRGSDPNDSGYAGSFGNIPNSAKSSLGYIRTGEVYSGNYKVSVRLDGLSTTNSNIRDRAIVFHGWNNVHERNVIEGRSAGCITLDWAVKDGVLEKIKEGSLIYVGVSKAK